MRSRFVFALTAAVSIFGGLAAVASAESQEKSGKLEVGALFVGQVLNEYRGSKATDFQALPVPFVFYTGDILKVDRSGARLEFFNNDRFEFKLSGSGALSGGGEDSARREGMPELDTTFELGPSFNINLTGKDFSEGWQLDFPVRAVVSVDGIDLTHRGFTFNPKFEYKFKPVWGWNPKAQVGATYGSREYHEYYYDVDAQFVTENRPAFESDAGFSGYFFRASLRKRTKSFFYGVSLRYDNLNDAEFIDSPLVETRNYFALSFAIAYIFWTPSL